MKKNLKVPIEHLLPYCREGLRVRISNNFRNEDIRTLGDLCKKTDYELLRIPNFGGQSMIEIKKALAVFGLELARDPIPLIQQQQQPHLIARWKPIESAPKDGTIILAANGEWVATMSFVAMPSWVSADGYFKFRGIFNVGSSCSKEFDLLNQPTHWVHLQGL
jgi:hypothetical protein